MAPQTRRTPQPKTAKAKTKTKPTPSKKTKTANTITTEMAEMKKVGHHPEDESFFDGFLDLFKSRGSAGTTKVPRTNAGKNQPLDNWVRYIRKRKALGMLPDHHGDALNGIEFQWIAGQSPRGQVEAKFTELEDFKKTNGTVSFLGEGKKEYPKLPSW
jgi:hypothetical protein